jgi:hypothetical protein
VRKKPEKKKQSKVDVELAHLAKMFGLKLAKRSGRIVQGP